MKGRNSFVSMVIIALCVVSAFGQQKLIDNAEFSNAVGNALSKSNGITQRVISTERIFADGLITETIEHLSESIARERSRTLIKTTKGDQVSEKEWIRLINVEYFRENGGPWKKQDDNPFRRLVIGGGLSRPPGVVQYQHSSESVTVDGAPMQIYEVFIVNTKVLELTFQKQRTWIGVDGLVYREESIIGKLSPMVETNRTETIHEYDPNIKIEAPIK